MRKLIGYFIRHSVAVNVVVFAFIIFGIVGFLKLKSSFFPLVDSKNISINVTYPSNVGKHQISIGNLALELHHQQ